MFLRGQLTNKYHYIPTTIVSVANKHGMMITYLDGLLAIKAHGPVVTWSCKITQQTKTMIFAMPQCL